MRVGYLLVEKKAQALGLLDIVKYRLNQLNIEVIKINDQISLEEQGPFNVIIHKISDYQRDAENGDKISLDIIKQLEQYEKNHINTCVFIDSPKMVFQLANRAEMSTICEKACFKMNGYNVYVPSWIQINSIDDLINVKNELNKKNIKYPILCKALNAAEGEGAHDMQLVFNEYQLLNDLKIIPCIAQSFINHDMNMCKIFLVGNSWCIVNRPSIRNFKNYTDSNTSSSSSNGFLPKQDSHVNESIIFNSHSVSKPDSATYLNKYAKRYQQHVSYGNNELLNDDIVNEIVRRLRMVIPFTLMGIDVIVNGKDYGLIDINFLPGYDGMANFYDEFFNLLISQLNILSNNKFRLNNGLISSNNHNSTIECTTVDDTKRIV